jgi:magnesium-transporting ATPase (P-type)
MLNQITINGLYTSILCLIFLKLPYLKSLFRLDVHENYFLTAFFALFVFLGIINSFLARTHRLNILANLWQNKVFILINGLIVTVQLYIIYHGGKLFRTYGLTIKELSIVILLSLSLLLTDYLRKKYLKQKNIPLGV